MKKLLVVLLAVAMVLSLAACGGSTPAETPADTTTTAAAPLADAGHDAWVAHGQFLLADGTENSWNGKDSALYEASALTAISLEDVKAIDEGLYTTLSGKDVKYLYTIDLIFGTNDAGWTSNFLNTEGKLFRANGSYCFKIAQCVVDKDGENTVYAEDQWISDPKTAYVEALTPETVFYPTWQEEKDENGFSWADNPVVTGGSGLYTLVIAQYSNASAPDAPGYGVALILKEAKDGIPYEEVVEYVPGDHTYGIIGSFVGSEWGADGAAMESAGDNVWTGEVELKAGDEFKVRADGDWTYSWGTADGGNLVCEADGTYIVTITFNGADGVVEVTAK